MMRRGILVAIAVISLGVDAAWAQTSPALEVGAQITSQRVGELDSTDVGVGGRAAWHPSQLIGVEGELNYYGSDIPDRPAISRSRVEGLFGITAGPRIGQLRPFARIRPGFLRVGSAPGPVACILIFPAPLSCALAGGDTLFALDVGGGVELFTPGKTFVRFDLGDRMVRYVGPAIDRSGDVHNENFIGHDLRVAIGAGWRF
jgi:hypothetical protein